MLTELNAWRKKHDRMDPQDRELLEYARRWAPYGGPRAADIFVEFGMTPSRFAERVQELSHLDVSILVNDSDEIAPGHFQ